MYYSDPNVDNINSNNNNNNTGTDSNDHHHTIINESNSSNSLSSSANCKYQLQMENDQNHKQQLLVPPSTATSQQNHQSTSPSLQSSAVLSFKTTVSNDGDLISNKSEYSPMINDDQNDIIQDRPMTPNFLKFPENILNYIEQCLRKPKCAMQIEASLYDNFEHLMEFAIQMILNGHVEHDESYQHFLNNTVIEFYNKFCFIQNSPNTFSIENPRQVVRLCFKAIRLIVLCLKNNNCRLLELLNDLFSAENWLSKVEFNEKSYHEQYTKENDRYQKTLQNALINQFGQENGFEILLSNFLEKELSTPFIFYNLKPFDNIFEFLRFNIYETYFFPILKKVPVYYENLSDDQMKKELKIEENIDLILKIVKICKYFSLKMDKMDLAKSFEFLRLKLILRVLQLSSFSGKMNALNQIKAIVFYQSKDEQYSLIQNQSDTLATSEEMAKWLIENNVLEIILKDCLHQSQYVEKLDSIIRFLLKENALTLDCLDKIWNSQLDKHEIIVKNIHDLIAKLAWNFSKDQLNHLFLCFESSWSTANKKEREKLVELMRRLAEDDKDGSMANKFLTLLWNIAYNDEEIDSDIVDQALSAQLKILDYSKTCDKFSQKINWIKRCISEIIKSDHGNNVITAMKQIRDICMLFPLVQPEANNKSIVSSLNNQQPPTECTRRQIIVNIHDNYNFIPILLRNLINYMEYMRNVCAQHDQQNIGLNSIRKGRRFSHCQEVQERMDFLKFLLKEGELWLDLSQFNDIWNCLAQNAIFPNDRRVCFDWFSSLLDNETDLDAETYSNFLQSNIIKLDPSLMEISGVECFERFFKLTNNYKGKLICRNQTYLMEDSDLIGLDYLWKLILFCEDEAAYKAMNLLKEFYTNLGPKLIKSHVELHHDLIQICFDRLKASYDTVSVMDRNDEQVQIELTKMTRVLSFLCQYIQKCDSDFPHEKSLLPMSLCLRGETVTLFVKFTNFENEEFSLKSHSNEMLSSIKNKLLTLTNVPGNCDIELYNESEKIDLSKIKLISQLTNKQRFTVFVRFVNTISLFDMEVLPNASISNEHNLPGVIMSKSSCYTDFLFSISDLAMSLGHNQLRENCLSVLKSIPLDANYVKLIVDFFRNYEQPTMTYDEFERDHLLKSPTKALYLLLIIYALLLPTNQKLFIKSFIKSFVTSGHCLKILNYLNNDLLWKNADNYYRISALLIIMKLSKFTLLCCYEVFSNNLNYEFFSPVGESFEDLKEIMKNTSNIVNYVKQEKNIHDKNHFREVFKELNFVPNTQFIESVLKITWTTGTGVYKFDGNTSKEILHQYYRDQSSNNKRVQSNEDCALMEVYDVCNESIKLSTVLFMLAPKEAHILVNYNWQEYIIDLLLFCKEESVRSNIMEHFTMIFTKCVKNENILSEMLDLMFISLRMLVPNSYSTSSQFFEFFCNILSFASHNNIRLPIINNLLTYEFNLLYDPKKNFCFNDQYEEVLEGHLKITKELIMFLDPEAKFTIGTKMQNKAGLVKNLMDQYLFTASRSLCLFQEDEKLLDNIYPVCFDSRSSIAAYELLVALCVGCFKNLRFVAQMLDSYLNKLSINSWDYFPNIFHKSAHGFVGLKNAGATCYMNSVIQQLFMIPEVRNGILSVIVDGLTYHFDDPNDENIKFNRPTLDTKAYNIEILKQIQIIFGHLLLSQCQYYVPKGFWQHFKLLGNPINLKEHQDALEFFNSLYDSLDEALKALNQAPVMANIFGGLFSDQKICKDCPHRYCREESFTTLNVDIRNKHTLSDSLEQYVHGDLLEGDNAYYCEKCDRKVNTVKRLCIKKLPKILVIQLKRFDYDYEREVSIKFNDYFEFPRTLNMEPYTVDGLARKEGEIIEESLSNSPENKVTDYELNGIVVHSGQANGGHYYSFILYHHEDGRKTWYKFEDVEVMEWKLDQDEEMKSQCFGGDNEVESDNMKKKNEKRWWNAFILVYRKVSKTDEKITTSLTQAPPPMPLPIRKNIQHQNIIFMHQRTLFSEDFYYFMKSLLEANIKTLQDDSFDKKDLELISFTTLNIAAKFLFSFCFRVKKPIRWNAMEWYNAFVPYLQVNSSIRKFFAKEHILNDMNRIYEFLLECPSSAVRNVFGNIIFFLYNSFIQEKDQLADDIMNNLIKLSGRDLIDNIKHSGQYFQLFYNCSKSSADVRRHLLSFEVVSLFMQLVSDSLPGMTIKSQYIDCKLFQVVSILVRSCNVPFIKMADGQQPSGENPFSYEGNNGSIMDLPENIYRTLFLNKSYMKKIVRDALTEEENEKLLKFCCWENESFSRSLIIELLTHLNNSYSYEIGTYFAALYGILNIIDSRHEFRLQLALFGDEVHMEKERVFLDRSRNSIIPANGIFEMLYSQSSLPFGHFEKRANQCFGLLINLFHNPNNKALDMIKNNQTFRTKLWILKRWFTEDKILRMNMSQSYPQSSSSLDSGEEISIESINALKNLLMESEKYCNENEIQEQQYQEQSTPSENLDQKSQQMNIVNKGHEKENQLPTGQQQQQQVKNYSSHNSNNYHDPNKKDKERMLNEFDSMNLCSPKQGAENNNNEDDEDDDDDDYNDNST